MTNFYPIVLALAMVTAALLTGGSAKLALDRQTRARGILMLVAALVVVMNVMISTV